MHNIERQEDTTNVLRTLSSGKMYALLNCKKKNETKREIIIGSSRHFERYTAFPVSVLVILIVQTTTTKCLKNKLDVLFVSEAFELF